MAKVSVFSMFLLFAGCTVFRNTPEDIPLDQLFKIERTELPKEFYLENRMGCDNAIVYMDHFVIPGGIPDRDFEFYNDVIVMPSIPYENEHILVSPRMKNCYPLRVTALRFYLAPECFVNMDAQKVYDIFVKPKYHKQLKEIDYRVADNGYNLYLHDFGVGFKIRHNKVISVGYGVCTIQYQEKSPR